MVDMFVGEIRAVTGCLNVWGGVGEGRGEKEGNYKKRALDKKTRDQGEWKCDSEEKSSTRMSSGRDNKLSF